MIEQLAPLPEFLVTRYKKWQSRTYLNNDNEFKKLESLGQNPSSMVKATALSTSK